MAHRCLVRGAGGPVRPYRWQGEAGQAAGPNSPPKGAARVPLAGAYPLLLYLVKAAACVGGGWLFFRLFERPFLNTRQRQEEREVMGAAP